MIPIPNFYEKPAQGPIRPEILLLQSDTLIWRAGPSEEHPTWRIQIRDTSLHISIGSRNSGGFEPIDFREVKGRLNEVITHPYRAKSRTQDHIKRLHQSLHWQRNLDACDPHIPAPAYFGEDGWSFGTSKGVRDPIRSGYPLDLPVLRQATEQMMLERREERLWAAYSRQKWLWAEKLRFDTKIPTPSPICRARAWHYWQIHECRELFESSNAFLGVFCTPRLIPELENVAADRWPERAREMACLPRREWMDRLGLPPTQQCVKLFSRVRPELVSRKFDLVRHAFHDEAIIKKLSSTVCGIGEELLLILTEEPMPLKWALVRQLCGGSQTPHWVIGGAARHIDFFRNEPIIGPKILKLYRNAEDYDQIAMTSRLALTLRRYWNGLLKPERRKALAEASPPIPDSDSIKPINEPRELISISMKHELCLEKYVDEIIRGNYALYQINHEGQFAVAGIRRNWMGDWSVDQIKGTNNAELENNLKTHFQKWLGRASGDIKQP